MIITYSFILYEMIFDIFEFKRQIGVEYFCESHSHAPF
jgi:hypothetical protein